MKIKSLPRPLRPALIALVVLCAAVPAAAWAQLEVDQLELVLNAGTPTTSGTFAVKNVTTQALTATLTLGDWERAEDGTNRFVDSGTLKGSCSPQVEVFPATLRLEKGESQSVRVTWRGSASAAACWSSVMVESAPVPTTTEGGAQLLVQIRTAVKVYVQPPDARPGLEILDLDVARHTPGVSDSRADTTGNDVVVRVTNPGGVQARVKGRVEYRTLTDSVVARSTLDEFPILPGAVRKARVRMPNLPAGRYVALVLLDYGGADIVAGQIELDIAK